MVLMFAAGIGLLVDDLNAHLPPDTLAAHVKPLAAQFCHKSA
jgi:hypothetical protein